MLGKEGGESAMKLTIKAAADRAGVSIRALRYYDEIGLLCPETTPAGYRIYTEREFARLQEILFYREVGVPLLRVKELHASPNYRRSEALILQQKLLRMQKHRLEELIALIDDVLKGEREVETEVFGTEEITAAARQYEAEAAKRWGNTPEYAQSNAHKAKYSKEDFAKINECAEEIFRGFAAAGTPDSEEVQKLVGLWREHISKYYYDCSKEVLAGLGQMYAADERFKKTIDDAGGEGTAEKMSQAIAFYCK